MKKFHVLKYFTAVYIVKILKKNNKKFRIVKIITVGEQHLPYKKGQELLICNYWGWFLHNHSSNSFTECRDLAMLEVL